MDPNEALRVIRNAISETQSEERIPDLDGGYELHVITEAFTALDEWIVKGGFLPEPWARGQKR